MTLVQQPSATSADVGPTANVAALDGDPIYARRLLITVILGVIAFSSSMTIVSAVLGDIATGLKSTPGTVSWAVTGLFLTMAIGTPVMGRVGDAIGRRRVFLIGTAILAVGTVACALAWSAAAFIAFRMICGLGIACTMPNGMAMVIDAYPPERRAVALGWFQMVMTGAPVLALVVGANLTEAFGWRSVFVLLTPIAALGFILGVRNVKDQGPSRVGVTIDWFGAASLGTAASTVALRSIAAMTAPAWQPVGAEDSFGALRWGFALGVIGVIRALRGSVRGPFLPSCPARGRPVGGRATR